MTERVVGAKKIVPAEVTTSDEIATFVLHEHKVKTIEGVEIDVPKASWGKELQIVHLMKDVIKAVIDSGVLTGGTSHVDAGLMARATEADARIKIAVSEDRQPDLTDVEIVDMVNKEIAQQNSLTIAKVAEEIFASGPDKLTKAVMVLLGKDEEWVEDNLESEEMLGLVVPFLYQKRQSLGRVLGRFSLNRLISAE